MIKYEIKKVFSKTSNKMALLLLLIVFMIVCWFALGVDYVNEKGDTESGITAIQKLHQEKQKWEGVLDKEQIAKVIIENGRISKTSQAMAKDIKQNNIAYSWKQGFSDIRDLLNVAYSKGFQEYDYYLADSLSEQEAEQFYSNRTILLKKWLNTDAKEQFSEKEKAFLIQKYEELKTPFYYKDAISWKQLFEYSATIIMITMLILGYLVAGIFSTEFQYKSDSIFYSSYYGRNKAIKGKLWAGYGIITVGYWGIFLLYSLIIWIMLGTSGAELQLQTFWGKWKSFYNITNLQAYLWITLGGYLGCFFLSSVTMLVSAKTKSTVLATITPFVLIFIPSFISNINHPTVNKIIGLLPDQLLQISTVLGLFNIYDIMGKVYGSIPILIVLYIILSIGIQPLIYKIYQKTKQIA